jgi:hypothetical protein
VRELAEASARENLRRMTELSRLLIERGSIESPADWAGVLLF